MNIKNTLPAVSRPSGWKGHKGDKYWTKESKYGMRYMCQACGKNNLGVSNTERMHRANCPHLAPPTQFTP